MEESVVFAAIKYIEQFWRLTVGTAKVTDRTFIILAFNQVINYRL